MKILWLVNIPLPAVVSKLKGKLRGSGHWIESLRQEILKDENHEMFVLHPSSKYERDFEFSDRSCHYFGIPATNLELCGVRRKRLHQVLIKKISEISPDVVDVHGSEYAQSLVTKNRKWPTVMTLQGFVSEMQHSPFGDMSLWGFLKRQEKTLDGLSEIGKQIYGRLLLHFRARNERDSIGAARSFIGRTNWDREVVAKYRSNDFSYSSINRIERDDFYTATWIGQNSDSLFCCGRTNPAKGYHVALHALKILESRGIRLKLRMTVDRHEVGWGKHLGALSDQLGLTDRVSFLGYLSESQIVEELKKCFAYLHPSFHDNSPNSLAEAQLIGVPCIASRVGGIPSMITDRETGVLAEPGSAENLADKIVEVVSSSDLARSIGEKARCIAIKRHDKAEIARATVQAYREAIDSFHHPRK
ncbi:MAG: glycosyltransferase family 4 protein [Pirellula sp.]|jgi:glycosyltransferase involved in cell wall biosynthesis